MKKTTIDGNTAAAYASYAFSDLAIIYPITPSSPMAELADLWQAQGKENLFGKLPEVVEMQSEGGAAGALHGALTCGALATTYTCSQGLLLMLPNMYKIAGEALPTVFHVSARALSTHALSIFGDHQDVMACRQTGFSMLCASSVQEVADFAVLAHLATLSSSLPFLHFFDGFRTSHETSTVELMDYDELKILLCEEDVARFKARALSPDAPTQRGTAQNPDVYFQNRERIQPLYAALPDLVQCWMDKLAKITKRQYHVFDYYGDPAAEQVLVMMGSGAQTAQECVDFWNRQGKKIGVLIVRLYRPFDGKRFCSTLPKTCRQIAVLDRTKEAGSVGEPLYLDVCGALAEGDRQEIAVVGGRYGLGQKEFTPAMVAAVLDNLCLPEPKNHFTVGIDDDISHTSLPIPDFHIEGRDLTECKFYGLGSDGSVGANKNSIQLIGEHTDLFVQGYFQYDSRKSGGYTISHLRFGKSPIRSAYLVEHPGFVACHNPSYLNRYDMLSGIQENGTFLLNCPWADLGQINAHMPPTYKQIIAQKNLRFFVIDGTKIAGEAGLPGKHSTVMQAAFFRLHPHILPYERAIQLLEDSLRRKFSAKGEEVINANLTAISKVPAALKEIAYPKEWATATTENPEQTDDKNGYFNEYISPILRLKGDSLPVSVFSIDGTVPTDTAKFEKHGVAASIPRWVPENCIQCNQCSFVCPHACIRPYLFEDGDSVPQDFHSLSATGMQGKRFRIQVSVHDCMGCGVCARTCPAKNKALVMTPANELPEKEGENWAFAQTLPSPDPSTFRADTVKGSQFKQPLFEFSYACAGCGETPYIKLLTQLFGERLLIANATGCSSIYGGSSPTCPYAKTKDGKGPAWASSLFEDNAEFGLGMRLAYDLKANGKDKSVWCIGGDGWAYDIGYGGLDHVLACDKNVNVLVLDSEVYSNTGGQLSKATPLGATARFAVKGKRTRKKPLGLMAMQYKNVYVAQVSLGANMQQLVRTLLEAEAHDGPALVIAYTPCIAHGVSMSRSVEEEKRAVECGYWHLYRYNPSLRQKGENPFILDSKQPTKPLREFLLGENRFAALLREDPETAERLFKEAEEDSRLLYEQYSRLANLA